MQEWISVNDKLPEDDLPKDSTKLQIKVLVCDIKGNKSNVRTLTRQRWVSNYKTMEYHPWEWSKDARNITHWMPLPELPRKE